MALNENNTSACFEDPNLTSCDYSPRQPKTPYVEKVYAFELPDVSDITDTASEGGSLLFSRNFGNKASLESSKSNKCCLVPSKANAHFCQTPVIYEHSVNVNYADNKLHSMPNQHQCRRVNFNEKPNLHSNSPHKFRTSPSLLQKLPTSVSSHEYLSCASTVPKYCCSLAKEKASLDYLLSPNSGNGCQVDAFGNESCEIITRSSSVNCDINLNEQRSVENSSPVTFQSSSPSLLHNEHESSESPDFGYTVEKEENLNACFIPINSTSCNGNLPNQLFSSHKCQKPKDKNCVLCKNKSSYNAPSRKSSNQVHKCCSKVVPCLDKNNDGISSPNSISSPKSNIKNTDLNCSLSHDVMEYLREQDEKLNKLENQMSAILNEKQSFSCTDKGDCSNSGKEAATVNCSEKLQAPKNIDSQGTELDQNFVLRYLADHNHQIQKLQNQINLLMKRTEELESFNSTRNKTAAGPEPILISKQCQTNDLENSNNLFDSDRENKLADESPVVKPKKTSDLENISPLLSSNHENKLANEIKSPKENSVPLYESAVRNIDKLFLEDDDKNDLKSPPSMKNNQPKSSSSNTKVKSIPQRAYSPSKRKHKSRKESLRRSSSASSNTSVDSPYTSPKCVNNAIDSDSDEQVMLHESSTISQYGLSSPYLSIATKQYLENYGLVRKKSSYRSEENKNSSKKSKLPSCRWQLR